MLFFLSPYAHDFFLFNLFKYITFRTGGALATSLIICFVCGPAIIRWLKSKQGEGQPIRSDGPETHLKKKGTPTMGGLMILIAILSSTLLWADLTNIYIWVVLLVTSGFGLVGFMDDYRKLTSRSHKGTSSIKRLAYELSISLPAVIVVVLMGGNGTDHPLELAVPFLKDVAIPLGILFFAVGALVITGASNAVNLTDGLDGLAIVPVMIAALVFAIIAYLTGNAVFANYLQLHHVPGAGELAVFCGALVGGCLGFLWFNAPPAQVFMGDTGALSLGSALGSIAVITRHELVLAIVGGLFVMETVSVIVQVVSYQTTGKRVFRMAPLHHHFEKKGWSEPTVVIRFWIIACILGLIGLSTLKLR